NAAAAEPLVPERVPEPLRPWIEWALHGREHERCPFLNGNARSAECAWPAQLELAAGAREGSFVQQWRVFADTWVPLPGDEGLWPQAVRVDGASAPVVDRNGRPSVRLRTGGHEVRGSLHWDAMPEMLQIPPETGLLAVSENGAAIAFPKRDVQGRLWLRSAAADARESESRLAVTVHRRVVDEIPMRITTRIRLEVSGPAREVLLGRALLAGAVPMSLEGPLPARLDPDGKLRVQVRPGSHVLSLEARLNGPVEALALAAPDGPWDDREEWVFEARPSLRLASVEGAASVDPQQTELPEEWRALPAYAMEPGSSLRFATQVRGDADPAPDRLSLARTWWLDFDGRGYTVTDHITGAVVRSDRLSVAPGTELGRVAVDGADQFITRIPGEESAGVEIPRGPLDLTADSRVPRLGSSISATGWDQDFASVTAQLMLPPGWRLLHAAGVDEATETWVTRWTLLDFFAVLVGALAFARLFGREVGALALAGLALTFTEPGAPRWVWLFVLAAEALRRAIAGGRLAPAIRWFWRAALLALALIAIPFAVSQIRSGFFPALEDPRAGFAPALPLPAASMVMPEAAPAPPSRAIAGSEMRSLDYLAKVAPSVAADIAVRAAGSGRYGNRAPDPKARITTGPGLPTWSWRSVALTWRGPVERGQMLRLVLAPPWLCLALALLRVALLAVLALAVLVPALPGGAPGLRRLVGAAAALAVLIGAPTPSSSAEAPTPEMLDELRNRLLERPACHPECAASPRLRLDAEPARLVLRIDVDAAAATAVPLPGGPRDWVPEQVIVDGAPAAALRRAGDGVLWLQVDAGAHEVLLSGALPDRDTVEIPLPLKPHRVEAAARGWTVRGIGDDGAPEDNLQLARRRDANGPGSDSLEAAALPPFVSVERALALGLTWQVHTTVRRLTPADATVVLAVPLLPGESVTTPGVRAVDGHVSVSLAPGVAQTEWTSTLDVSPALDLRAPEAGSWVESWILDASPVWHVEAEGIPMIHEEWREWRPWPGEGVHFRVTRPEGVEGATLTIDASHLRVSPGRRAADASLDLDLRSSLGGQHAITLPEGAVLERVAIDGADQPIRQQGRTVMLPLAPGARRIGVVWREPRGIGALFSGPEVDLGAPSANSEIRFEIPPDRWLLWLGGPRLGPSVLFWPLVAVLAALAAALGPFRVTPLRKRDWFLLGIGMTQAPLAAAVVVAGWLFALGWRGARGASASGRRFDLVQIALAVWTLAALAVLCYAIQQGLLGLPEMQVAGNGSSARELVWYQDRAGAELPRPWVLSVPVLAYRALMLAWALWLATSLIGWLRWGWAQFAAGELWRGRRRVQPA
ncbi:MAG TPA: hypothetical protein VKH41_03175, partial [Myxococcota bacterium]|nr:hypothetical protein [Myxococcota bacterium]